MNVFAKFGEIPSMIFEVITETKLLRTNGLSDGRTDNVKTVYPPTNTVCGGYIFFFGGGVGGSGRGGGGVTGWM